ncbi:MAG: hypothetical protein F9K23_00665 [Bacteroidetes bacterium]|nr:MAG: hypothetical protein F9K23_00665 [Bacteroidota bacterium]
MKTVKAKTGQGLEDLALQEYGCIEGQVLLWQDNGMGPDTLLYPGQPVLIRNVVEDINGNNQSIARFFAQKGISPANNVEMTSYSPEYVEAGYWIDDYAE